jgi:hypothetical protein
MASRIGTVTAALVRAVPAWYDHATERNFRKNRGFFGNLSLGRD